MTSYCPDINVWIAMTAPWHPHSEASWRWARSLEKNDVVAWTRHAQLGYLRLLNTEQVMGKFTLTIEKAWEAFMALSADLDAQVLEEPESTAELFRKALLAKGRERAPKFIADAYLIAFAKSAGATLVTFDGALMQAARANSCRVLRPG
jgi:toxin-antitoxin system PIN domain toxin